jgi:hypothetical protein
MDQPVMAGGQRGQTDVPTYSIPVALVDEHPGQHVIVRARDPTEVVARVGEASISRLVYIQLLAPDADVGALAQWGKGVPVDVVLGDPVAEYPLLYRVAPLCEHHPVRVTVPVVAGFSKAVKLAVALHLAVRLEFARQPDAGLIEELAGVLDLYLHRPTVSQPVEPFHSLLLCLYGREPTTLWSIQEEDSHDARYITDDGEETLSARFRGAALGAEVGEFVRDRQRELLAGPSECARCQWWQPCRGYFKWPQTDYACDGVKRLFRTLWDAAEQLRADVAAAAAAPGGSPR